MRLEFIVYGLPQPKGSTKSFAHPVTHAIITTHDNPKTRSWQGSVATAAADAAKRVGWAFATDGAVSIDVVYVFLRPPSVSSRKRPHHIVKPDGDKLERAILDALTGVLWRDDAQVVEWSGHKRYADPGESASAMISVSTLASNHIVAGGSFLVNLRRIAAHVQTEGSEQEDEEGPVAEGREAGQARQAEAHPPGPAVTGAGERPSHQARRPVPQHRRVPGDHQRPAR